MMTKMVKIPRIPQSICKFGKLIVTIAKIILVLFIAGYDFAEGTNSMEMQKIAIIIGGISMIGFFVLELLGALFDEAALQNEQAPLSDFIFYMSSRFILIACVMATIFCVLPNIIKITGDPIEVTVQSERKNTIQTNYVTRYVETESEKPLYPINLDQNGVVILSASNDDEAFVRDFISNNEVLLNSHNVMINNSTLSAIPENQDLSALEFVNKQTSMAEILESQSITNDVLYVGSPNLSNYSGEPIKHSVHLVILTGGQVTAEEKEFLNQSFESIKIIRVNTIK